MLHWTTFNVAGSQCDLSIEKAADSYSKGLIRLKLDGVGSNAGSMVAITISTAQATAIVDDLSRVLGLPLSNDAQVAYRRGVEWAIQQIQPGLLAIEAEARAEAAERITAAHD